MNKNGPQFPLYIPTKTRWDTRHTAKALDGMGVKYRLVIEPSQYKEYLKAVGDKKKLLVMDLAYKEKYELCDNLGLEKSTGPGPARNFIWDHSISEGYKWHWVMDDNIRCFYRLNKNKKHKAQTPAFWRVMEEFCMRYENVGMAGPNYEMFAPRKAKIPPFITNTRIYSCNLIRNDIPFRWRGRYNEDTILSLDMLKKGWCTIQFNACLQDKIVTQAVRGGNSAEFYDKEGTKAKSEMQVRVHPDVSKVIWRFNRVHHHVDYSKFKKHKLIRKEGVQIIPGVNNYGMELKKVENG